MAKQKPIHHPEDYGLDIFNSDDDMFRWFLLVYLLGKPIQSSVARNTWQIFIDRKLDTPWSILALSNRQLVGVFHEGRYTRYQHVMAHALHTCMEQLVRNYEGSLLYMLETCQNEDEMTKSLQKFYGVGPKTAQIFMREVEEYFARRVE